MVRWLFVAVKNKPGGRGCDVLLTPTSAAKTVIFYAAH